MAYDLIAFLTDGADITIGQLAQSLREEFASDPGAQVRLEKYPITESHYIAVRWDGWSLRLSYEDEPHVQEEAQEIANLYAGSHPDRERIAECRRRITMSADDDPDMDHFNDYCFIMQHLGEQTGVILFDPQSQEFPDI